MNKLLIILIMTVMLLWTCVSAETLDERLNYLKKNINSTKLKINDLTNENLNLKKAFTDRETELKKELESERIKLDSLMNDYKNMSLERIDKVTKGLAEAYDDMETKLKSLENFINIHTSRLNSDNKKITELESKSMKYDKDIKKIFLHIEDLNRLKNLVLKVNELERKNRVLEQKIGDMSNTDNKMGVLIKGLDADIDFQNVELKKMNNRVNKVEMMLYESVHSTKPGKQQGDITEVLVCPEDGHIGKEGEKYCTICGAELIRKKISNRTAESLSSKNQKTGKPGKIESTILKLHLVNAEKAFNAKDYEKAISEYTKVIDYDNTNLLALYNLGVCYYSTKKYYQAISSFTKVIKLYPEEKDAYIYLGILYYKTGNEINAIRMWKQLLIIDPENEIAKENLRKMSNESN